MAETADTIEARVKKQRDARAHGTVISALYGAHNRTGILEARALLIIFLI